MLPGPGAAGDGQKVAPRQAGYHPIEMSTRRFEIACIARATRDATRHRSQRQAAGSRTVQRPFTHLPPALHGVVAEHASPGMAGHGQVPIAVPVTRLHPPPRPPPLQTENSLTLKKPQGIPGSATPIWAQVRFSWRVHHKPSFLQD
jgi:hypothetical protein